MKIAYNGRFYSSPRITGVERFSKNLLKALISNDTRNEYVIFAGNKITNKEYEGYGNTTCVTCSMLSGNKIVRHLWEQCRLPGLVKEYGCDVLFNPGNTGPITGSVRSVLFVHDVSFIANPQWFSKEFRYVYGKIVPLAAKRASRVITVSRYSKSEIIKYTEIQPEKVHVVYQSIEQSFHENKDQDSDGVLARHNIGKPYILFTGSLDPRKNLDGLIKAFLKLKREHAIPHTLVVVGAHNVNFSKMDYPLADNKILFCGYVNDADLRVLYQETDLFVYPSFYEGFGLPPLEAMACGAPVVASSTSSLPEVCGDAAVYVDPLNVDSIADGMASVLNNKGVREILIVKGKERVRMFNWEKCAEEILRIIEEIE
jgi:glycosyltransferase involved in cell wall biosynthesis